MYPADVSFFEFSDVLAGFQRHECKPGALGGTLTRRLTHGQLTAFLSHVPSTMERYLRLALTCSKTRDSTASACSGLRSSAPLVPIAKPTDRRFPFTP